MILLLLSVDLSHRIPVKHTEVCFVMCQVRAAYKNSSSLGMIQQVVPCWLKQIAELPGSGLALGLFQMFVFVLYLLVHSLAQTQLEFTASKYYRKQDNMR